MTVPDMCLSLYGYSSNSYSYLNFAIYGGTAHAPSCLDELLYGQVDGYTVLQCHHIMPILYLQVLLLC